MKRLPDELKNVEAKKEREFNLIANVMEMRLKDNDNDHLESEHRYSTAKPGIEVSRKETKEMGATKKQKTLTMNARKISNLLMKQF